MDEILDYAESICSRFQTSSEEEIAKRIADWALPGDRFCKPDNKFINSGLSLAPFFEVARYAKELNGSGSHA